MYINIRYCAPFLTMAKQKLKILALPCGRSVCKVTNKNWNTLNYTVKILDITRFISLCQSMVSMVCMAEKNKNRVVHKMK